MPRGNSRRSRVKRRPTLPGVGQELRLVLKRLEAIHSHVRVCSEALKQQNADEDFDVTVVLRLGVTFPLEKERQRLAKLASECDGEPIGDDYVDACETA